MKAFKNPTRFLSLAAGLGTLVLSSCNRGMGCPTNFSVSEVLAWVVNFF